MKKLFKRLSIFFAALFTFLAVGCTKPEEVLQNYIFEQDGTVVSDNFELPHTVAGENVKWASSNTQVIQITQETKDDDYVAVVTLPETRTEVTLTISYKDAERNFTVFVNPVTAQAIGDNYTFTKNRKVVTETFELPSTATYKGKECPITWEVVESGDCIQIVTEGTTQICKVTPSSLKPTVKVKATFTYGGESYSKIYSFSVSVELDAGEMIDSFYTLGSSPTITGYVVGFTEEFPNSYGNAGFYLLDESKEAGYYVFRATVSEADNDHMVVGAKVTLNGFTTTIYNGLMETNSGASVTFCQDAEGNYIVDTEVIKSVYALDEEILGNLPSTKYHESQYVSLNAWKVTEVKDDPTAFKTAEILKLEKNGVTVYACTTKYVWSWYTAMTDAAYTDIIAKKNTFAVGDYVNVTGLLNRYSSSITANNDGFEIYLTSADGLEKTTEEAAETVHVGVAAGTAYAANVATLETAGIINESGNSCLIVENKEFTLPTTFGEGGTIEYTIKGSSNSVTINNGVFTVVPQSNEENTHIQVTYKIGEREFDHYFYIHSVNKSNAERAEYEGKRVKLSGSFVSGTEIVAADSFTPVLFSGVTYTFAPVEEYKDFYEISEDGKTLIPMPVDEETTVKVNVVTTCGTETYTKEVSLKVAVRTFSNVAVVESDKVENNGEYLFGFNNGSKDLFTNGKMSSYYGATTSVLSEAAKVVAIEVEGGYNLKCGDTYINLSVSGTYYNFVFGDTATTVWTYADGYLKTAYKASEEAAAIDVWIGSNGIYGTIGAYPETSKAHDATGNYPGKLYKLVVDETKCQGRADAEIADVKVNYGKNVDKGETYDLVLAGSNYDDVKFSYALKDVADVTYLTIADGKLTVNADEAEAKAITVVVNAKCGQKTATKEVVVTIEAATTYATSVEQVYDLAAAIANNNEKLPGYYVVTGFVSKIDSYGNLYISDDGSTTKQIELYKCTDSTVKVGDRVTVKGFVTRYNTTYQMVTCTILEKVANKTVAEIYAIGAALENKAFTTEKYVTVGVVESIANAGAYNQAIWLTDGTCKIEVYGYFALDTKVKGADIKVGDSITIVGYVQRYSTTYEFTANTVDGTKVYPDCLARVENANAAAIINAVKADELKVDQVVETGAITLPTTIAVGEVNVQITWALEASDIATLEGNVLTVSAVTEKAAGLNLTATLSIDGEALTIAVPVAVVVKAPNFSIANAAYATAVDTAKKYIIGVDQENLNQVIYFTGSKTGNYGVTSAYSYEAAIVEMVAVDGGYNVKLILPTGETKYLNVGTDHYMTIDDAASTVFSFVEASATLQVTLTDGVTYYMGSYSKNTTVSFSAVSYLGGAGNFACHLYEVTTETTMAGKANYDLTRTVMADALKVLPSEDVSKAAEITLATSETATVAYAVTAGATAASVNEGKLTITLPSEDTTVTVQVTVTAGAYSYVRSYSFKIVVPTNSTKIDFSKNITSTDAQSAAQTLTNGGVTFVYFGSKAGTSYTYMFIQKNLAGYFANTTAFDKEIVSVKVGFTAEGSAGASVYVSIGKTAISTFTTAAGEDSVIATGTVAKSGSVTCSTTNTGCNYFNVSIKGSLNTQVSYIEVTFAD